MTFHVAVQCPTDIEERMPGFFRTVSGKDRRQYAAGEASELGSGGIAHVATVLGCSARTIERAAAARDRRPDDPATDLQLERHPTLELEVRTAGDPDAAEVVWTEFSAARLAETVAEMGHWSAPRSSATDWRRPASRPARWPRCWPAGRRPTTTPSSAALPT